MSDNMELKNTGEQNVLFKDNKKILTEIELKKVLEHDKEYDYERIKKERPFEVNKDYNLWYGYFLKMRMLKYGLSLVDDYKNSWSKIEIRGVYKINVKEGYKNIECVLNEKEFEDIKDKIAKNIIKLNDENEIKNIMYPVKHDILYREFCDVLKTVDLKEENTYLIDNIKYKKYSYKNHKEEKFFVLQKQGERKDAWHFKDNFDEKGIKSFIVNNKRKSDKKKNKVFDKQKFLKAV